MPEAAWPALPDPNPVPPGTDLRTTRKGKFSTGQRFDMEAQLRHVAAIRLKSEGKTYAEIAEQLGYSSGTMVASAIQYALKRYVPFQMAEYAKVILAEQFRDLERVEEIIQNPGYRTDVKGQLELDPDGRYMEDEQVRIAALTEKRKIEESIRRLIGTDAPKRTELSVKMDEELNQQIQARIDQFAEMRARLRPVAALPDDDEDIIEAEIISDVSGSAGGQPAREDGEDDDDDREVGAQ